MMKNRKTKIRQHHIASIIIAFLTLTQGNNVLSFGWSGIIRRSEQSSFSSSFSALASVAASAEETVLTTTKEEKETHRSPLSCNSYELSSLLEGSGRARAVWDCYRHGIDPSTSTHQASSNDQVMIGRRTQALLEERFGGSIRDVVAEPVNETVSTDGTTKILLQLKGDGLYQVETCIIPWEQRQRSTLCVSSQVGCQQGCTFCATGKMGKLRSLRADEILAQVFFAIAVCQRRREEGLYPIDNVVFMGMGEPADNSLEVLRAVNVLTDSKWGFGLAPRRVTISTVAPSPEAFAALGRAPAVLAWSVHSSRDDIRRQLVPTTRHSMSQLRGGLIEALLSRSRRRRSVMLEVTLLDGINDSKEDALHLAKFCEPLLRLTGLKLVVNLIPWNDISAQFGPASRYQKPSHERVLAFQSVLVEHNILCYVRITRGDDESAACGQLVTARKQQ